MPILQVSSEIAGSEISVRKSNFTRNRGQILALPRVAESTKVLIDRNAFTKNILSNVARKQSVAKLILLELTGTEVKIVNNFFDKNTVEYIIDIGGGGEDETTNAFVGIAMNRFQGELANF